MNKFKSEDLINELQTDVKQMILAVEHMKSMDRIKLAYPLAEGKWTAMQCLEHLNIYNRYYLPAIEKAMSAGTDGRSAWFTSGRMGNYFTNLMKPGDIYNVGKKMKTAKAYNPPAGLNVEKVINEFIEHQQQLLLLLERARNRNLGAVRVSISISKFIKLKLGDTFRFLVAHEQRHLIQARNAIHGLGIATDKFPVILQAVAH